MGGGVAALQPDDAQKTFGKVNLVPPERDQLAQSKPVPVGDQDKRGVPVTMPSNAPRGVHQRFDFFLGQVLTSPNVLILRRSSAY